MDEDKDPTNDVKTLLLGVTAPLGNCDHSTVFLEACRENYDGVLRSQNEKTVDNSRQYVERWTVLVASHEIGYQPGTQSGPEDHAEGGIMAPGCDGIGSSAAENANFTSQSISRFRKANRWSE